MKIQFTAENGFNTMKSEDGTLYAEIKIPDDIVDESTGEAVSPVSEDYGYLALKAAILELAFLHGVPEDTLEFWYDGQENFLSDDAKENFGLFAEYREA